MKTSGSPTPLPPQKPKKEEGTQYKLTTIEKQVAKKKLDELCTWSETGFAVVYQRDEDGDIAGSGGERWVRMRYKDGRVTMSGGSAPPSMWTPLNRLRGFPAWLVKNGDWEPHDAKHPLELLAMQAEGADELIEAEAQKKLEEEQEAKAEQAARRRERAAAFRQRPQRKRPAKTRDDDLATLFEALEEIPDPDDTSSGDLPF